VHGIVFGDDPGSSKRADDVSTATCPVMWEVSKFSCEIKDLLMISARFLRDSINDKPRIDDGELGIIQALQVELIPK
jgi:hypothetical protein